MGIYRPTPIFSSSDKRLLVLIAKLLLEQLSRDSMKSNVPDNSVALTDREAAELIERLEKLTSSREFLEGCYFAEGLTALEGNEEPRLREIYLSARKRRGRSRAVASMHWATFLERLGVRTSVSQTFRPPSMNLEYFLKMESKLLSATDLHPRVVDLVMRVVASTVGQIDEVRSGDRHLTHGAIKHLVIDPILHWRDLPSPLQVRHISTTRVAAAITVVADFSVLFTTRDWSVTGTLSTIAGALATMSLDGSRPR